MFDFLVGNDLLSAIVAFVLVLIPAVLIHEIGHFLAAKAVGITILEFGIGLPPRLARLFTYRGTEYTLNWLPLGGFVRPLGEDVVRQMGDEATERDRDLAVARGLDRTMSVNEAPPLSRIFFFSAGALANFVLAIALFTAVALIGIPEIVGGRVVIVDVPEDSVLAQAGLEEGDIVERIDGVTFSDSADFMYRLYAADGEPVTLSVVRPGDDATIRPDAPRSEVAFTPEFGTTRPQTDYHPIILGVSPDSPAEAAGIQPGDLVTAINGLTVTRFSELRDITQQNLGEEMTLTLRRDGETVEVTLTPRVNPPAGQGAMGVSLTELPVGVDRATGVVFQEGPQQEIMQPQSFPRALGFAFSRTGEVITTIVRVPSEILAGTIEPEAARPVSVVGIGQMGGAFLQQSVEEDQPTIILNFIAVVSIALGLTNLLPLPALDGGRIFFVLLEIVRGRPIAPEREGFVHLVGLAILLSAMVVLMLNDIVNPVTNLLR